MATTTPHSPNSLSSPIGSPTGDYRFPAGPAPKPFFGSAFDFRGHQLDFVTRMQREYGDAATVPFPGGAKVVMLFTPSAVRYILQEHPRNFTSREFNYGLVRFLGDGLLTIDGDFHRQQRRLVQPAFHKKRIEHYAETMTAHTEQMLETWHAGETRNLNAELQSLTLRIVAKALFDVDLAANSRDLGRAFTDVITMPPDRALTWQNLLRFNLPFLPYGRFLSGKDALDETVYAIIRQRRADRRDTGDVVSMLLKAQDDDGATMTDKQVRDEIMTLFAAGHETTMNALSWTWYLLSEHPDVEAKLREELQRVLNGRTPTVDDLPQLVYTDMVLKESMRLYPPAWTIGRRAVDDFEVDGYKLPKGQMLLLSQWVIHRMPQLWGEDVLEFKPERFDPEHPQEVPQGAYFPFGLGPRMCIGMPFAQMEARLVLATVAQQYRLRLVPNWPVVPQARVTIRPRYGLRMQLLS